MRYLIVNGSPRKGNTWQLVDVAKRQLEACDGGAEFEEIDLSELRLPFCTGCSNCFRLGHEKCPHHEKVSSLVRAIEQADGVIVASATFNMRETALLKNCFDHLSFMLHRPRLFRAKALVLTTTGGIGAKAAAKGIVSFLKGIGFNHCDYFATASLSWNAYEPNDDTTHKLRKATLKFYRDVASKMQRYPATSSLIPYNLFRGMSLAYVPGTEFETADGVHWMDPVRRDRVYDNAVPVCFLQKPIGHMFYLIGKCVGKMKSMQVTYRK